MNTIKKRAMLALLIAPAMALLGSAAVNATVNTDSATIDAADANAYLNIRRDK